MREDGACTAMLSTEDLWPKSSNVGFSEWPVPSAFDSNFHCLIVRSLLDETMRVGFKNLAAFTGAEWPLPVATTSELVFHIRIKPS